MNLKYFVLAGVSAAAIGTAAMPALALPSEALTANQWYTAGFGTTAHDANAKAGNQLGAVPVLGFGTGTNGPILPSGVANATPLTKASWSITAVNGGYLTITDVESSGDQFQLTDNGIFMSSTTGSLGGQAGQANGLTSTPVTGGLAGENIASALGNADFSSGTFALATGVNVISATLFATTANASSGDANFIVELNTPQAAPEPVSLSLLGVGLAGIGMARRRRNTA